MDKARIERNIVVMLFVFVIVLFSLADKDSKKLKKLYTEDGKTAQKLASDKNFTSKNQTLLSR